MAWGVIAELVRGQAAFGTRGLVPLLHRLCRSRQLVAFQGRPYPGERRHGAAAVAARAGPGENAEGCRAPGAAAGGPADVMREACIRSRVHTWSQISSV